MTDFPKDKQELSQFRNMISEARFSNYLTTCSGNEDDAFELYRWNMEISNAFYKPLQIWEICLRNQMNRFLVWKVKGNWPYHPQTDRILNGTDSRRLAEAKVRQQVARGVPQASTDAIVADLSLGFWVSMLTTGYDAKFAWRHNLIRVFPNAPADWLDPNSKVRSWSAEKPYTACDRLLELRNRIAHHEPVYNLDLSRKHDQLLVSVAAMCSASANLVLAVDKIDDVIQQKPN